MTDMSNAEFIRDLAARMFRNATPAMGFDQGDTDRLYVIANRLAALEQAGEPVADDPEFREYVRKAGQRLAPHSADPLGSPTRDALVWINAALHPSARERVPLNAPIAPNAEAPLPTLQRLGQEFDAGEGGILIAAGVDDYAAKCALRTDADGVFCHAYFYSDGQWRFQTGGNDIVRDGCEPIKCLLTKPLYAHPPQSRGQAFDGEGEAQP